MATTKKKAKKPAKNNGVQSNVLSSKNFSERYGGYPHWAFDTKREWLRAVRKRWAAFKRARHPYKESVMSGSAFYPKEVYEWLQRTEKEFEQMTLVMREYYKNA